MRKLKQLQNSMLEDGTVPQGTYIVEDMLKIVEYFWRKDTVNPCVGIKLLPTHNVGDTITLKRTKRTVNFKIVFYGRLNIETNIKFVNDYIYKLSKVERSNFLTSHSQLLSIVLKDKFEEFYLDTIFQMGKIPDQFDVWRNGKRIGDNFTKKDYLDHPKEFSLVSYKKLD